MDLVYDYLHPSKSDPDLHETSESLETRSLLSEPPSKVRRKKPNRPDELPLKKSSYGATLTPQRPVEELVSIRSTSPSRKKSRDESTSEAGRKKKPDELLKDQYFRILNDNDRKLNVETWRIDMVLAYEHAAKGNDEKILYEYRHIFLKKLRRFGLKMQTEFIDQSQDGKSCFVKVHAPFATLSSMAELNGQRMPVKPIEKEYVVTNYIDKLTCGHNPFQLPADYVRHHTDYYFVPFKKNRLRMFHLKSKDTFFTRIQRISLVWEILIQTRIFPEDLRKRKYTPLVEFPVDLVWLLQNKVFSAAYPLHEGDMEYMVSDASSEFVENFHVDKRTPLPTSDVPHRCWLGRAWASRHAWHFYQPLRQIRNYFGETIGFYFAWLGFYTQALVVPTVLGIISFIYGLATLSSDLPTKELCGSNVTVCRLCVDIACPFNVLENFCMDTEITYVMDNYATPLFAFCVALWSCVFMGSWKRKQAVLALEWDVYDFEPDFAEIPRPEYYHAATKKILNPITDEPDMVVPKRTIWTRLFQSISILIVLMIITLLVFGGVVVFEVVSMAIMANNDVTFWILTPKLISDVVASLISTICMMILEVVYGSVAWHLTERECLRTESEFERSFVYKVFVFQFINFYGSMIYYAFFEGKFVGSPMRWHLISDRCTPGSCYESLATQFLTILVVKQTYSKFTELYLPKLQNWWRSRKTIPVTHDNPYSRWEKDLNLCPCERLMLAPEYTTVILQYGLITMWAAAFPLAPLLALINNIFEMRIDALKFLRSHRRAVPKKARGLGVYMDVLTFLTGAAVIFNGAIICFSTSFIDRIYYQMQNNGSLAGFYGQQLSWFNTSDWNDPVLMYSTHLKQNVTSCVFVGMRNPPGTPGQYRFTEEWFHIMLAKMIFLLLFITIVFTIQRIINNFAPEVQPDVLLKQQRQQYIARTVLYNAEFPSAIASNTQKPETPGLDTLRRRKLSSAATPTSLPASPMVEPMIRRSSSPKPKSSNVAITLSSPDAPHIRLHAATPTQKESSDISKIV